MLSGPGSKVAGGDASDYGGDGEGDGVGEDADLKEKDVEAPIRVRRVDFNADSENHYIIVIHGTFDAPPADGAPTWYQPPPPGEQNFCRKLSRLLALGPIGENAIWRDLPCSALPGIPYPFHWDGTNTHAGRVTAAMKVSDGIERTVSGGNERTLHNLIDQIAQNDPAARIHLVAHSHGGNVMLKTIELYMAKIGRRQKGEWHPAVEKQFWVAHRRSYQLIKKWRRIDMRGSWWRFFPFLVVYRGFNGQKTVGVKESYPWAYQQWLDSLLRLPAVRQRRFLAFRHATSPITNALGALVFLGTPFYIKKWQRNGLLWFALSLLFSVALMYVFIIAYTSFIQFIVLLIAGRLQDFYTQSGPHFLIATSVMLLVLIKQIMDAVGNTVFYSGNLYHNPAFDWSPAMSALVIHAGKLDEASLALSMEPITRAYVFPHLTKLLKQTPWAPFPKPPTRYARQVDWWAFLFHCAIILVWDTLFFLPAAIMSVCSHIIAPIVTGTIQKMVVTISFGLSAGDLNHAYIYVDEHLDLDLASQQVDQWNVQKLLAEAKTKSLKGELMPGYEDDTVEQPEWLEPVSHSPHPHVSRSPLRSPRTAAAATSVEVNQSKDGVHKRKGFGDVVEMRLAGTTGESAHKPPRKGFRSVVERRMAGRIGTKAGGEEQGRLTTPPAMEGAAAVEEIGEGGVNDADGAGMVEDAATAAAGLSSSASGGSDAAASSPGLAASSDTQQHPSSQKERMVPVPEAPEDSGREKLVYEFLWDDQELAIIAEQSQTFQRLKSQMNKIGRNPRLSEREFERQLQQLCVMIEERMGELTGKFDLNHGAYFRDPRILRVIAHFIEKRELPEWSKDMDGDIWRWNENLAKIQSQQLRQMATGSSSGGAGEGEGKEGGEGEGKSRTARLKSMLKNMRGGSYREGGGATRPRAVNLADIKSGGFGRMLRQQEQQRRRQQWAADSLGGVDAQRGKSGDGQRGKSGDGQRGKSSDGQRGLSGEQRGMSGGEQRCAISR
ncbi:unnamed protein product [Closterium sp. NIES-64]|nr:unnamed protein product [Closterium sp. NIES-64]